MTYRELMQQALEALEDMLGWESLAPQSVQASSKQSLQRLREALAHPDPEPVAWMVYTIDGKSAFVTDNPTGFGPEHKALPLYTTPPQREPLTNGEIYTAYITATNQTLRAQDERLAFAFARAIERAHGIGEKE